MLRVWLAVTAVLAAAAVVLVAAEAESGPIRKGTTSNAGHTGIRGTAGHGKPSNAGRGGTSGNVGHGGEIVKAELITSFRDLGQKGKIGNGRRGGTVGNVSPRFPLGVTGGAGKDGRNRATVTAARVEKIATAGRNVPISTNGHSGPLSTVGHTTSSNTVAHRKAGTAGPHTSPNTHRGSFSTNVSGNRRGNLGIENRKRSASDGARTSRDKPADFYQAAKIAAAIDRAIPIDLSKYSRLDRDALLRLSSYGKINRAAAMRLFGKGETSHSRESYTGSSRKGGDSQNGSSQEPSKDTRDSNDEEYEGASGGSKIEILDITDIGNNDDKKLLDEFQKGDGVEVTGSCGEGSGICSFFSGEGNNRERPSGIGRFIDLSREKGDVGDLNGSRKRSLGIIDIFDKDNSRERPAGLFGKGRRGDLDIFGLLDKSDSKENSGGGLFGGGLFGKGAAGLDIFGLFNKGSREKLNLFSSKGSGSKEKSGSLFDLKDYSDERSGGLFANKGRKGGLFGNGFDILGIFNKGSKERSGGLFNKGYSRERPHREYIDSIETSDVVSRLSQERRGGLLGGKGIGGGLFGSGGNGFNIFRVFNKGSRERPGLFGSKGRSRERLAISYSDGDDSREKSDTLFSKGKSGGLFGSSEEKNSGIHQFFDTLKNLHDTIWGR